MTTRSFSADLSRFGVTVDKRMTSLIRQAALNLLDNLHAYAPVDSGWLRGSWAMTLNVPSSEIYSYGRGSWAVMSSKYWFDDKPKRGMAMRPPQQKDPLPALRWTDKVYFTNNVPYSGKIENRYRYVHKCMMTTKKELGAIARRLAK